jgi:hypothetical protein
MTERIINNGQATEAEAEAGPAPEAPPAAAAAAGAPAPCPDCLSARAWFFAALFAAFAAYVAADFMTGGRLTGAVVGLLGAGKGTAADD